MTAVTPLSFSQRNSRRSSARRMPLVGQPAEQRLDRVEHDALGADRVDRVAQADEQPFEIVLAGLLDLAALDRARWSTTSRLLRDQPRRDRSPARRRSSPARRRVSSKLMKTPGSPNSRAPRDQELDAEQRLAAARRRRRPASAGPRGRPPPVISSSPRMPVGHLARASAAKRRVCLVIRAAQQV